MSSKSLKNFILTYKNFLLPVYLFLLLAYWSALTGDGFVDDHWRSIQNVSWNYDGRISSTLLYSLLNGGYFILNMGALPQFLALAVYMAIVLLVVRKMVGQIRVSVIILSLPVALMPYVNENMAFKFDSFTMALSLLMAVLPFFVETASRKRHLILTIVSLFFCFTLYQQAINAYIICALFFFVRQIAQAKPWAQAFRELLFYALALISMVLFFLILDQISLKLYTAWGKDYWISFTGQARGRPVLTEGSFMALIKNNISTYFATIFFWWRQSALGLLSGVVILGFCGLNFFNIIKFYQGQPVPKKIMAMILVGSVLFFLLIGPVFIMLFSGQFVMRFRYLYSSGILLTLMLLSLYQAITIYRFKQIFMSAAVVLLLWFTGFSAVSAMAINRENEYSQIISYLLAADLNRLIPQYKIKELAQYNKRAFSPQGALYLERYPVLYSLLKDYTNYWLMKYFYRAAGVDLPFIDRNIAPEVNFNSLSLILTGYYYNLYLDAQQRVYTVFHQGEK